MWVEGDVCEEDEPPSDSIIEYVAAINTDAEDAWGLWDIPLSAVIVVWSSVPCGS